MRSSSEEEKSSLDRVPERTVSVLLDWLLLPIPIDLAKLNKVLAMVKGDMTTPAFHRIAGNSGVVRVESGNSKQYTGQLFMLRLYQSSGGFLSWSGGRGRFLKSRLPAKRQKLPLFRKKSHSAQSPRLARKSRQ